MDKPQKTPSYDEIKQVIRVFYAKVLQNQQIGHFFAEIENFTEHEQRIADFWWMSMGGQLENPPKIDMIGKHFALGIKDEDLQTWLALFSETLEETLSEEKGVYWMDKVLTIAARLKQIVINHQAIGLMPMEPKS